MFYERRISPSTLLARLNTYAVPQSRYLVLFFFSVANPNSNINYEKIHLFYTMHSLSTETILQPPLYIFIISIEKLTDTIYCLVPLREPYQ